MLEYQMDHKIPYMQIDPTSFLDEIRGWAMKLTQQNLQCHAEYFKETG